MNISHKKNLLKGLASDESGFVLVTALLIMLVLTLMGTAAIMTTTTDVKISANFKNYQETFYTTDGSVQEGMDWLVTNYDVSYHPENVDYDHDSDAGTATIPTAVDPVDATDHGYGSGTGNVSYTYHVVSLDPEPSPPAGYTPRQRTLEKEGFSAKQTTAYAAATKMWNYYYQVDASGAGSQNAVSSIEALAAYRCEN